jgi:hypothetical protein
MLLPRGRFLLALLAGVAIFSAPYTAVRAASTCKDNAPGRVLVYSSQKTGASLMVDALGQYPRTVTLDLYPGKEGPEPGLLPRPMSAFQIYAREVMDEEVKKQPTLRKEELFKAIGDKYFGMSPTQQAVYKEKEQQSRLPEMSVMTVVKAVTNPWTLGWQYVVSHSGRRREQIFFLE